MQFQREGYPHLPGRWPDLDCDGNTYISGYGFIHLDPQDIERHEIKRSASIAGGVMLMLLLLPGVLLLPAQLLVRYLGMFLNPRTPDELVVWTAVLEELRTGIWMTGSYLIPIFFLIGIGGRDIRQRNNTAFSPQISFLGILCALGVSGAVSVGANFLNGMLQRAGFLVVREEQSLPTAPAAVFLFLLRVCVTVILEEIMLRGLLLRVFRKHGDAFALMMTAIVSGLTAGSVTGDLAQFTMALVYGYLMLRTGSLLVTITGHLFCTLWPAAVKLLVPGTFGNPVRSMAELVLIILGLVSFAFICSRDPNAFILSPRSLDYGKLSGRKGSGPRSFFPFRSKLAISLSSAFFSASAVLWLLQVGQNMLLL